MRKLVRPKEVPKCLVRAKKNGAKNWQRLRGGDRREIWSKLNEMQHRLCAYCETPFTTENSHIEHLYPRAKYEELTFEWKNLFGSCNNNNSCGIYKDGAHNPHQVVHEMLIKPDQEDPRAYFRYYRNGRISVKPGLSDHDYHRAKETIRGFNLNHNALASLRRRHLEPLQQLEEEFILWCELCDGDPELLEELAEEIHLLLVEQKDSAYQSIKEHYIHNHLDLLGLVEEKIEIEEKEWWEEAEEVREDG